MKILVTGASGFIGSFLCEEGLAQHHEVWAGVRRTSSRRYLQDKALHFLELDFSDEQRLEEQLKTHLSEHGRWNVIIHCAGVTKCVRSSDFELNNYMYTRRFIEAIIRLRMEPEQFVYLSSLSVFGPIRELPAHAEFPTGSAVLYAPITNEDEPCPNTAYGKSKLKTEQWLNRLGEKFPTVIFRPTGVYGPRERDYFLMVKSIKNHVDFSVGFRRQEITFIYVKDLVKAIYLAVEKKITGKSYFVSDGGVYESRSFSDFIQRELGDPWVLHIKSPLWFLRVISFLAGWGAGLIGKSSTLNNDKYQIMKQRNWQCDITPLCDDLGFKPEYDLDRGVSETIAWYKQEKWL